MKVINIQPIERPSIGNGSALDIHSIFHTIQGEGPHVGRPAVFIRLAGCNLQCPACDTEYTQGRDVLPVQDVVEVVRRMAHPSKAMVVLTGGEPFRQNLSQLVQRLHDSGYDIQIETNGTRAPEDFPYALVDIVCSPKAGRVNPGLYKYITAYKYVINHQHVDKEDGLPTRALDGVRPARPHAEFTGMVYVNPQDDKDPLINTFNQNATIHVAMRHGYTFGLQVHKLINME
jgi:organic radical activating enzyme